MERGRRAKHKGRKSSVVIVDDHPIVRKGLAELINQEEDFEVCGEAEDEGGAIGVIESRRPDVAIVDISLKGGSGLDLIKSVKTRFPEVTVLVLSMHDETLYAERVLRAGARGYIMKQVAPDRVVLALRQVLQGKIYVSDAVAARMLHQFVEGRAAAGGSPLDRLSNRELEVFQLIGRGNTTRQIAEKLRLSVKTVESHREHIKEKLSLPNAPELIRHAVQWLQEDGGS